MKPFKIFLYVFIGMLPFSLWADNATIESLEASLKSIPDKEKITVLNELATAYQEKSPRQSLFYGEKALKLAEEFHAEAETSEALNNIGLAYRYLSDYDKALEYFFKALKIQENSRDKRGIAGSLHYIGTVFDYLGKYDNALKYHKDALKIREEIGDKKGAAHSLHNIGVIYHQMNRYTKALEYYEKGLAIREEIGDKKGIAGSLNNIGFVYKDIFNYAESLDYYLKALNILEEIGDKYEIANISNNIGELYLKIKNYKDALTNLDHGLKLAQEIGAKELVRENYLFHSEVFSTIGNYQKALEYYKQSAEVKDRIFTEESSKKIADMQTKYETEKKEREIELLKKDNHIKHLQLGTQRLLRNSLFAGLFFVLLLALVMYNRYRLKKKAHAELSSAHDIIKAEKAKSDKLLLNILPLRVANDLKERGETEPESYENVTVYFSDIVGFTKLSSKLEPRFLIEELNEIFTAFDNIIEKHQCERIKTIGDAYLCVCGMPEENPDHAENIVQSAIEIIAYLQKRNQHNGVEWKIRVGIHTGKVVGGVVGVRKYIYDVFGDTINTASRMESNSEPMRINISEATYQFVREKFAFIEREPIAVKGKGQMKMYFVDIEHCVI